MTTVAIASGIGGPDTTMIMPFILVFASIITLLVIFISIWSKNTQKVFKNEENKNTICTSCGKETPKGSNYCNHCGAELKKKNKICRYCNNEISDDSKYCNNCGSKIE